MPMFEHVIVAFGLVFNRAYCAISIAITALFGYYYSERVTELIAASNLTLSNDQ